MSRSTLTLTALAVIAFAPGHSALAGDPTTITPKFYFTTTLDDRSPQNAVLTLDPGETGSFFLLGEVNTGDDINSFDAFLGTPTPQLATPTDSSMLNPMIGSTTRWDSVQSGPAFVSGIVSNGATGLSGNVQSLDSTYDPNWNNYVIAEFEFTANNFPDTTKSIFTSLSAGGSIPAGEIQVGIGDDPIVSGVSSEPDVFIQINGTTAGLTGDYNGDGVVNGIDYAVWRNNVGTTNTLPNRRPDAGSTIDQADYDFWVSNYGNTSRQETRVAPTDGGDGPSVQIVDQGTTAQGNRSYMLQIATADAQSAMAVELALTGNIVDVRAMDARVNDKSHAAFHDGGISGYDASEDTWYDDDLWQFINRGANPITQSISPGFTADYDNGTLFIALGSGLDHGPLVDLIQVIVGPDEQTRTFEGIIAQNDVIVPVSGVVPEPAALLALAAIPLFRRTSRAG